MLMCTSMIILLTISRSNVKQQDIPSDSNTLNSEIPKVVDDFNAENNDYKVVFLDYSDQLTYENSEMKARATKDSL